MKNANVLATALLGLVVTSCGPASWRNAERAYEAGDMPAAVRYAAQTLRDEPGHEDALNFLQTHLERAYDDFESNGRRAEEANDWDEAFRTYESLQSMSDAVRWIPPQIHPESGAEINFPTRDVADEISRAKSNAAEMHYQTGVRFESDGRSKEAAMEFRRTLWYDNAFRDAREKYDLNRQAAVKRVAVMPFENLSGKRGHGRIGDVISDRLIHEAMKDPDNMEFMEFVTRERLSDLMKEVRFGRSEYVDPSSAAEAGRLLGLHAFVFGKVTSIVTDYLPDIVSTYEDRDELSTGKDRPKRKVRAVVTVVTRRATAKLVCTYQIVDVERGTIIKTGEAPREEVFEVTFGKYRGDKEALQYRSRQLCKIPETYPPPDDELVARAAEAAARDLASEIAAFFR